jgi:hypothetical protein
MEIGGSDIVLGLAQIFQRVQALDFSHFISAVPEAFRPALPTASSKTVDGIFKISDNV